MKTEIVVGVMVGLFLIGIATASLLNSFGVITGSVEVVAPTFYLGAKNVLYMNEIPSSTSWNQLSGGDYASRKWTMADEKKLGGIDFYSPEIKFVINVNVSNLSEPRAIDLEFGFIDENKNERPICRTLFLNIDENGIYEIPCLENEDFPLEKIDKFYFLATGKAEDILYKLKTQSTYVEIIGVAK